MEEEVEEEGKKNEEKEDNDASDDEDDEKEGMNILEMKTIPVRRKTPARGKNSGQ
jgi:hypothetical protein